MGYAVGKIDLYTGAFGEDFAAMHLAALVISHRLSHRRWLAAKDGREAVYDRLGGCVFHLGKHHKSSRAFDQRSDRGTVATTLNQVAFPLTWDEATLDF
jgi:hypothetical protein